MIHYTCDLCAGDLQGDQRYVVNMDVFAAQDPAELTEDDLDEDHMEEVSQQIQEMEENAEEPDLSPTTKQFRYDLCCACHKRFLRDPLGRELSKKVSFSKN